MLLPPFLFARAERLARARDLRGLLALFVDPGEKDWQRAIAANAFAELHAELGSMRDTIVAALLRSVDEDAPNVRSQALFALAEIGASDALPAFRQAARDRDFIIRTFAAHGFMRLATSSALADLSRLVEDDESQVREAAVSALAALGPEGRLLVERVARQDPYRWVRDSAREALAKRIA